jgi:hypothetical protein
MLDAGKNFRALRGRCGRDRMVVLQSVSITTNIVSSNPIQARCTRYNICDKVSQ